MEIKKALLIQVPGFRYTGLFYKRCKRFVPAGLFAVSRIFQDARIDVSIFDLCADTTDNLIKRVKEYAPSIIGYSGVASSYGPARDLSGILRKYCPDAVYISGGPLASTYDLLLEDKAVDYVFHGEVEASLPKFLRYLKTGQGLDAIGGISFSRNGSIVRAPLEKQLTDLDGVGLPDYGLINLDDYVFDLAEMYRNHKPDIDKNELIRSRFAKLIDAGKRRYMPSLIFSSRGCTHRCKFCYRHMVGLRRYSVEHVVKNIMHMKKYCRIDGMEFGDELFNSDTKYVMELCDALADPAIGLDFYMAAMRADKIDEALVKRLAEAGFININFGQESGSDTVLNYYGKGVSRQKNIDSTVLVNRYGIHTTVQLVIGSPVETSATIAETADFLKKVDARQASINYLIPLPESPIWDFVVKNGLVTDVRKYLDRVATFAGAYGLMLNLTKAKRCVWIFWSIFLERTVLLNRFKWYSFRRLYYFTYMHKVAALLKKVLKYVSMKLGVQEA